MRPIPIFVSSFSDAFHTKGRAELLFHLVLMLDKSLISLYVPGNRVYCTIGHQKITKPTISESKTTVVRLRRPSRSREHIIVMLYTVECRVL